MARSTSLFIVQPGNGVPVDAPQDEMENLAAQLAERARRLDLLCQTARQRGLQPGSGPIIRKVKALARRTAELDMDALDEILLRDLLAATEDLNRQLLDKLL